MAEPHSAKPAEESTDASAAAVKPAAVDGVLAGDLRLTCLQGRAASCHRISRGAPTQEELGRSS
jgi:hypothetical protein